MNKFLLKPACFIFALLFSGIVAATQPGQDKHVCGGLIHSLYVDPHGNVWVWGGSSLSNVSNKRIPSIVMKDGRYVQSNFNSNTSFVIRQDGSLWGWGNTQYGQLRVFPKDSKLASEFIGTPRQLVSQASAVNGTGTVFVIKPDNSLWVWGHWGSHRGDTGRKDTVVVRKVMDDVIDVSSNRYHTLALQKDGTLWAWGDNQCGALGIGSTKEQVKPVRVHLEALGTRKVVRIAVRWGESYIVADDGTVWYAGEFAINQAECLDPPHLVPTRVADIDNVKDVALGQYHELWLKKDGSVWASGFGSPAASSTPYSDQLPRQVMDNVREIAAGQFHSVVLKNDGSVWTWGDNRYGQLGNGTTQRSAVPVQVHFPTP